MLEAYTGFIRNVKRADDTIRLARSIKPAFDRFLQVGGATCLNCCIDITRTGAFIRYIQRRN